MTGLLILIGLALITLNVLAIKKQNKSFNGTLGSAIENIDDYDIRLGELRRDFSESILELQSELMDMKEIMRKSNRLSDNYNPQRDERNYNFEKIEKIQPANLSAENVNHREENDKTYDENKNIIIIDEPSISTNNSNSEKVEEIKRLFSEGLSAEEIAEILHLGKGEVLLIKDLYIR